jgi:LacI family transcriptional regulator
MKKEKATIHDIASKLNIAASTVSRALNDHPRISDETKKLVLKAAEKLNYQANHVAAALRNGRSNRLGIVVPTADRSFFASVIRGVEEIANLSGYNVMICQTYDSYQKELDSIEALLKASVDGIIISYAKETENFDHLKKVKDRGIPLVMFDRSNDDLGVSQVVIDDYFGAYKSVEHLIEQGCKRIAHFTNNRKISIYKERLRGYKEALINHGIAFDPSLVVESNLQLEDGRNSMSQLLSGNSIPDAVFSASALGAVGAMHVLKERNIKIPDEVALVAFSNEVYASFIDPPLTTVDQHSMRMGNSSAEVFLEQIMRKDKFVPNTMVLRPELIIRASSLKKSAR